MSKVTEEMGPFTFEEAHECFYVGSSYFRKIQRRGEPDREENCTFEMNRLMQLVDHQYKQIEALKSEQQSAGLKAATILEGERRQFHHDVLCLVLKESIRARVAINSRLSEFEMPDFVRCARATADLAYPPPKEQP